MAFQPDQSAGLIGECAVQLRFEGRVQDGLEPRSGGLTEGEQMAPEQDGLRCHALEVELPGLVAKLIDQVKRENVKVYFVETSNDPRLVQQIAAATGARPGGKLYAESLSPPDGPAPTYLQMFRHNIDELVSAMTAEG